MCLAFSRGVDLIDLGFLLDQGFSHILVGHFAHLKGLGDVFTQLLLFEVFLPLFDVVVIAVDLLKHNVYLLFLLILNILVNYFLPIFKLLHLNVIKVDLTRDERIACLSLVVIFAELHDAAIIMSYSCSSVSHGSFRIKNSLRSWSF